MYKTCSGCHKTFPATLDYFHARNNTKNGLKPRCKLCRSLASKKYHKTGQCKVVAKRSRKKYSKTIKGYLAIVFHNINNRCNNHDHPFYKYYGGRGIQNKFRTLNEFRNYIISELQVDPRGLDCDRINNNGNYEKGNIRFVTHKENCKKQKVR